MLKINFPPALKSSNLIQAGNICPLLFNGFCKTKALFLKDLVLILPSRMESLKGKIDIFLMSLVPFFWNHRFLLVFGLRHWLQQLILSIVCHQPPLRIKVHITSCTRPLHPTRIFMFLVPLVLCTCILLRGQNSRHN